MRERKRAELDGLKAKLAGQERFKDLVPNNAFLASFATYTDLVPTYEHMLQEEGGDLERFYARVKKYAASPPDERGPLSVTGQCRALAGRPAQVRGMSTFFLNAGRAHRRSNQASRFGSCGRSIGRRIQRCTSQPIGMSPMEKAPATYMRSASAASRMLGHLAGLHARAPRSPAASRFSGGVRIRFQKASRTLPWNVNAQSIHWFAIARVRSSIGQSTPLPYLAAR